MKTIEGSQHPSEKYFEDWKT